MPQVTVTINGRNYRMACDDGQESHLESLADKFNTYVDTLKGSFGDIGDQRLTVMASIMVMDELEELKKKTRGLEVDLDVLKSSRDQALGTIETTENELAREIILAAKKVEEIKGKLGGLGPDASA